MEIWKLKERLLEIARLARSEMDRRPILPWSALVAMTAIERSAKLAVSEIDAAAGSKLTPTPPHLRLASLDK